MSIKTVGFIGTGGMGNGMAANLIKAGYRLVVTDIKRAQAAELEGQGAQFVDSPKAVAESCELVLSMLPNNAAVREVALGANGLSEARAGAREWIDFSSMDKATMVQVGVELAINGWTIAHASAGGVEEVAAAGQLALWRALGLPGRKGPHAWLMQSGSAARQDPPTTTISAHKLRRIRPLDESAERAIRACFGPHCASLRKRKS